MLLVLSVLLAACSARPRLVIVVEGAEGVPQLTRLVARSFDASGAEHRTAQFDLMSTGGRIQPVSFVVEPRDASRVVHVSLEARDGSGTTRIVRSVRVQVPEGTPRTLWVELEQCCQARTSCGDGMTCRGGNCVSDEVRSDELLMLSPGDELRLDASINQCMTPDAGMSDGGTTDSGPADGGADSGACPMGCACEASCSDVMCSCTTGCGCAFDCAPGSECTRVRCDGAGTMCTLDASGASSVAAICSGGARCDIDATGASTVDRIECQDASCAVDCTDASNCRLRCRGTSQCLFRCASPTNCDLMCMSGSVIDCGGGLQACNRACP